MKNRRNSFTLSTNNLIQINKHNTFIGLEPYQYLNVSSINSYNASHIHFISREKYLSEQRNQKEISHKITENKKLKYDVFVWCKNFRIKLNWFYWINSLKMLAWIRAVFFRHVGSFPTKQVTFDKASYAKSSAMH